MPSSKLFQNLFLISLFFTYSSLATRDTHSVPKKSTEFIKTSCRATNYPRLCFNSLAIHANKIQTDPQLLAGTALNVTLSTAKTTTYSILKLSSIHGLKPREASAMKDCLEELSDSVEELSLSIGEMSRLIKNPNDFKLMINDIQTWVSAALTDDNTCTDGLQGNSVNGKLKADVKRRIVKLAQLTSNALALINKYALIHG